jgi:hypothetical protein
VISRYQIRTLGRQMAQDAGPGTGPTGVALLLTDPDDYNLAVAQALRIFTIDKPNRRTVDAVATAGGFRLPVYGSGVLAALTGANAWVPDFSHLLGFWRNWSVASQGLEPADPNTYRLVDDPAGVVLELLEDSTAVNEAVRLVFTAPHALTEAPNTVTPSAAPTVALADPAAPGNVEDGLHGWAYTWVTAHGESTPSAQATLTVANKLVNGQVKVTIPSGLDQGATSAKVYRTVTGGAGTLKLVGTLAGGSGGIFTDNVADGSLGADSPATSTAGGANTPADAYEEALALLTGSLMLTMAANKAVQNTGNTGLPNDVVDRRSQASEFAARAKALREQYNILVGKAATADLKGASAIKDWDVSSGSGLGFLWHQRRNR